jgi:hypothetical protein
LELKNPGEVDWVFWPKNMSGPDAISKLSVHDTATATLRSKTWIVEPLESPVALTPFLTRGQDTLSSLDDERLSTVPTNSEREPPEPGLV